ncbi:hypothetical protein GTPT_1121 [Tatumella ptyseos ATCC 33301]|uniref:Uncharacterized protein n=1 Tax=Tatumella ptyseos ATCC 33301 TaxID=1005995 RepID=A0A085JJE2_9GAMM|nr:hypothetical protein GTPT_1121 [Tatumella ptyseos ATCC 33301]
MKQIKTRFGAYRQIVFKLNPPLALFCTASRTKRRKLAMQTHNTLTDIFRHQHCMPCINFDGKF